MTGGRHRASEPPPPDGGPATVSIDSSTGPPAARPTPDGDLVDCAREFLARTAPPVAQGFLADWPLSRARRTMTPSPLAATRWLAVAAREHPAAAGPLLDLLGANAGSLAWRQTYTVGQVGAAFIDNYGWAELVGPRGLAPSDRIACGILILGPHTHYPSHCHEAYEVYVPLAGTARWKQGERGWHDAAPGSAVEHASETPHAIQTMVEPLVALFLWRSRDLAQSARLEPP